MKTELSHNTHGVILTSIAVLVMLSIPFLPSTLQPAMAHSHTLPIVLKQRDKEIAHTVLSDDIVINGDFEIPDLGLGGLQDYSSGSTFEGWTVESGHIDLMPEWQAASGKQSVDLNGTYDSASGAIYQDLATLTGKTYNLIFSMSGNPDSGPAIKEMKVWWGDTLVDTLTFDVTGRSRQDMGWVLHRYIVTAISNTTRLKFESLLITQYGPVIDNVQVGDESTSTPFLDLPFAYSNFAQAAQGNVGGNNTGRVNSWFDHVSPNYGKDYEITPWQGKSRPYPPGPPNNPNINCNFGFNCYAGHNGIDFQWKPDSQTVYATASGTVKEVNRNWDTNDSNTWGARGKSYGNYVLIDHGNRYATFYAHLASVNAQIEVGTIINDPKAIPLGIMGGTGGWETHLHFGVYYDNNADGQWTDNIPNEVVDPYGWSGTSADPWNIPSYYLWKYPIINKSSVGSSGASLISPAGNKTAIIPPSILTTTLTILFGDVPPIAEPSAQLRSTGQSFLLQVLEWLTGNSAQTKLQANITGFAQPVTVAVTYEVTETLHLDVNQLEIYRWNETNTTWITLPTTVDTNQKQAIAPTTEIGNFDLQAPLLCPADISEPDDNYYGAKAISTNGVPVNDLFDVTGDQDWFKFDALAGTEYSIRTTNLAAGVDTALEIYDTDGVTPLASDDNGGGASELEWQTPQNGAYYIRVSHVPGSAYGCSAIYQLSVTKMQQIYLPLILRF